MSSYIVLSPSEINLLFDDEHPDFSVVELDISTDNDDIYNNVIKHKESGDHYLFEYEACPFWEFVPRRVLDKDDNGNVKLHKVKKVEFVSYRWERV